MYVDRISARRFSLGVWFSGVALSLGVLSGCETRVVHWRPPLAGLDGVQTGTPFVDGRNTRPIRPSQVESATGESELRSVDARGNVTLRARTARHLMIHIYNTLAENDADLFVDQVLSKVTRDEYVARGLDPRDAFYDLRERSEDVLALFNQMPAGESTPGVTWKNVGKVGRASIVRVDASGAATTGFRYTYMDMALENGNWRLRWFGRR